MNKPNFFIIGAPKCGTTSLAYWLGEHKNIYMSPVKEPHYFDTDNKRRIETRKEYEALFKNVKKYHSAIGEASVYYLFSKEAVPNILRYNPNAKFIVMLRNPVDMAYSLHDHYVCLGRENVSDFIEAWKLNDDRRKGRNIPVLAWDPKRMVYGDVCRLGMQVDRLLKYVDRERVLFVFMEDIKKNTQQVYRQVLTFLGVPDDGRTDFPRLNPGKRANNRLLASLITITYDVKHMLGLKTSFGVMNKIQEKNQTVRIRKKMDDDVRDLLVDYFLDDIKLLAALTGRDLRNWYS